MGTLVSALGCYVSVWADLPTGATIVCTFGAVLVAMALLRMAYFAARRRTQEARPELRESIPAK